MATNPQLSAAELAELIKLYKTLDGLTEAAAQNAAQQTQAIGNANKELIRLRKEYQQFTSDVTNALESFKDLTSELNKQKTGINESKKAYNNLGSIAEKILYHQKGISMLNSKELENLQKKAIQEQKRLEIAQVTLTNDKEEIALAIKNRAQQGLLSEDLYVRLRNINTAYRENKDLLNGINNSLTQTTETLDVELSISKKIEKSLGLTGALMKGMSKIPFLGDLPGMSGVLNDVEEDIRNIEKNEGRIVGKTEAMKMAFKKIGPIIKESLSDPLVIGGFFLTKMIKGFNELDKSQTEYTRQTGRNVNHLDTINTGLTTSSQYIKQATELTKQFGIASDAIFTPQSIQEATEMVELMGMSAEEAGALARFSKLSGKELKDVNSSIIQQVNNFNKSNKTGVNQRQVLEAVAKTSDHIAMTFGGNPEKIAKAVSEAKKLGLSLEQVDKIAESLLNFEDSISAELEAELLTGKQINLDQARYYALTNDLTSLTKEIGNNQEVISVFTTGNRIQQDAIAKSMGLSREEMAKMIFDQRMINGLSGEQLEKVTGMSAEDMKRLSLQESINNSIQKMSEALAGPLEFMSKIVSNAYVLNSIIAFIGTVGLVKMAAGLVTNLSLLGLVGKKQAQNATLAGVEAGANAASSAAKVPIIGPILAVAAIATVMGVIAAAISKARTPALAKGGTVIGEGSVLVGEQGPEVLSMKPGATVTPLSKVNAASESGNGFNVSINAGNTVIQLDGVVIAQAITQYVVEEIRKTSVKIQ